LTVSDWFELKLGDLFAIKHGYAFKSEFFGDQGTHVLLTPGNFQPKGGLKLRGDKEKFYNGEIPEEYVLRRGDLLVAMTDLTQEAPILGSPAFVPENERFLHNQRLGKVVDLRRDRIVPEYLFYVFNTAEVRAQLKGTATGATVRHTSPSRIYNVSVRVPPVTIQHRIAGVLLAYDEWIENNRRRIETLEQMAYRLYNEWFVRLQFPGQESAPLVASPLGPLPAGWEVAPLGALTDFAKGRKPPRTTHTPLPGDVPLLLIDALRGGEPAYAAPANLVIAGPHDTIMVMDGGSSCDVAIGFHGAVGSTLGRFRSSRPDVFPPHLLFWYLETRAEEFKSKNVGAAVPHANKDYILSQPTALPTPATAARFRSYMEPLHEAIECLRAQAQSLQRARDLLLPRLMSGQVRIDEAAA